MLKAVIGLEIFGALGGLAGGIPFLIDPSGKLLGYSGSFLAGTPISNFFLVGLWLTGIFGIGGSLVAYLLLSNRSYARRLAYLLGTLTAFWATLENIVFGPSLVLAGTQLIFCGPQIASAIVLFRTRNNA